MGRIDDHRQMAEPLDCLHRREIERVSGIGFKRADAALAEDDVRVARRHDVFRAHQPFADRRGQAALEQNRLSGLPQFGQQIEILHVARADLNHIHAPVKFLHQLRAHNFRADRHARDRLRLLQQRQPFELQPLKRIGRRARLIRAAAQDVCAACAHLERGIGDLLHVLHRARAGEERQLAPADLHAAAVDHAVRRMEFPVRLFERLGDRHHALDARLNQEVMRIELGHVAQHAQHRAIHARVALHLHPLAAQILTKAADLLLGGLRFHNDNHTFSSLSVYRGLKPPTEADRIEKDPRHGVAGA